MGLGRYLPRNAAWTSVAELTKGYSTLLHGEAHPIKSPIWTFEHQTSMGFNMFQRLGHHHASHSRISFKLSLLGQSQGWYMMEWYMTTGAHSMLANLKWSNKWWVCGVCRFWEARHLGTLQRSRLLSKNFLELPPLSRDQRHGIHDLDVKCPSNHRHRRMSYVVICRHSTVPEV